MIAAVSGANLHILWVLLVVALICAAAWRAAVSDITGFVLFVVLAVIAAVLLL